MGFPGGSDDKESACNVRGLGLILVWEMATHSSILAWRIPWTEEPPGLQSMVSRGWREVTKSQTQLNDFHFTKIYRVVPQQFKI